MHFFILILTLFNVFYFDWLKLKEITAILTLKFGHVCCYMKMNHRIENKIDKKNFKIDKRSPRYMSKSLSLSKSNHIIFAFSTCFFFFLISLMRWYAIHFNNISNIFSSHYKFYSSLFFVFRFDISKRHKLIVWLDYFQSHTRWKKTKNKKKKRREFN